MIEPLPEEISERLWDVSIYNKINEIIKALNAEKGKYCECKSPNPSPYPTDYKGYCWTCHKYINAEKAERIKSQVELLPHYHLNKRSASNGTEVEG